MLQVEKDVGLHRITRMLACSLFIQRVRNRLTGRGPAENVTKPKHITEAVDTFIGMGRERSMCEEGVPVRSAGATEVRMPGMS